MNTEPLFDYESIELMFLSQILVLITSLMERRLIPKLKLEFRVSLKRSSRSEG